MPSIQETVHRFFNDNISRGSDIDTPSAIYQFLGERGFLQAHVSERWRAFAESVGYFYVGDIDIQNKVATGVIPITIIDADAQAYFDVLSVQPSSAQKDLVNSLIVGLKEDNVWSRIRWLSLAGHDQQAMRVNMVNPTQIATALNSPIFTPYRGFQGDGVSAHLDSNVSNSTVLDTDHSLFMFVETKNASRVNQIGTQTTRYVISHGGTNNPLFYGFSPTLATVSSPSGNKELIIGSRSGGTSEVQSKEITGTPVAVTTTTPTVSNIQLLYSGTAARLAVTGFGFSMNQTQRTALRNRLLTYLTAIGAI